MEGHRLAEERSLALHREVAEVLRREPLRVGEALERVRSWKRDGSVHPHYAEAWEQLLEGPFDALLSALVDGSQRARPAPCVALRRLRRPADALADLARGPRAAGGLANRARPEHVIRATAPIAEDDGIVADDSRAILGQHSVAPEELLVSADDAPRAAVVRVRSAFEGA